MVDNIRETIELRAVTTGFDKAASDMRALGANEASAADSAELLARAQTVVERSLTRVQSRMAAYTASLDPAEKALKKLEQGEALVAAARARGLEVSEAMSRSVDLARERFQRLQTSSTGAAGALALTRNESLALTYTVNDVVASLSTGASPMTILMQQGGQLTQAFGGVRGTFEKLLPILARFAPLAAGAGVALAAFHELVGTYNELEKINEGAGGAGVSGQLFQVWINYATRLRLTVEDAEKAIQHAGQTLAGQVDNFSALGLDGGQSRIAQRANNLSDVLGHDTAAKNLAAEATTLDEMHRAALQLVKDYYDAAQELQNQGRALDANQARTEAVNAATEVWGDSGRKIAENLRDGVVTVDELASKSEETGRIWSDDILTAQKQVSQELATASDHLSRALNPAVEELARLSLNVVSAWAKLVDWIAAGVRGVTNFVSALTNAVGLGERAAAVGAQGRSISDYEHALGLDGAPRGAVKLPDITIENTPLPPSRPEGLGRAAPKARGGGRARAGKAEKDELGDYLKSLEKSIGLLQAEADAEGKSNAEKERALDLAKAEEIAKERGKPLTEDEIRNLTQLADRHAAVRAQIDETKKTQAAANDQMKFFGETAYSAIERLATGTGKLQDTMQSLAKSIEQAVLKAALLGEGPLASLLGTQGQNGAPGGVFGFLGAALRGGGGAGLGGLGGFLKRLFPFADGGLVSLAHLPRYAAGGALAPDGGFPILAHPGEIILNRAQQANVASSMGGGPLVVNVHNAPAGTAVKQTRDSRGGRRLDVVFAEGAVSGVTAPGSLPAMRQYGMRQPLSDW
ncbi:phage tail length tape measure family protein [Methylocystis parvus]|uniref:phage tail length tape measure family protein n=1 Tax=Methylocystis parvus TaxID=134 RepID=UPI003C77C5FD